MKFPSRFALPPRLFLLPVLIAHAGVSQGAAVVSYTVQRNFGFTVSGGDLLQTHLAGTSFTGNFVREGAIGTSAFNNGIYGGQGNQGSGGQSATADQTNTATFILDAGTGFGYDITAVDVYAGWDSYRGGQQYSLYYDTVSSPGTFLFLASAFNDAKEGGNVNTRSNIVDSSGLLAYQVRSLRFDFGGGLTFGYAGYREIDVQGLVRIRVAGVGS